MIYTGCYYLFTYILFNNAFSSSDYISFNHITVRGVKSRRLYWVGHIAALTLLRNLIEIDHMIHQGDWRIILKCICCKLIVRM